MRVSNNKGFSLIEVLVTVGLIGILVGIAIPSYNGYKQNTVSMALRADLGNGSKVYNAKYAVDSTYCHPFSDVGLPIKRDDNPIYKKGGFYGFGSVNSSDCGGVTLESVTWEANDKECYNATTKAWSAVPANGCVTPAVPKTKQGKSYAGGTPSSCILSSNVFKMGSTTNVSGLEVFYYADHDGIIIESSAAHGSFDCTP